MANTIIKGNELMVFDENGKSFAFATNHTLTINAETSDTSSKDHGMWSSAEITKYTWEVTSENLFTSEDYEKIFTTMLAGTPITIAFGVKAEIGSQYSVVDGNPASNWSQKAGSKYYSGKVLVTSLVANANNGENATYSVTFTGVGKLASTAKAS